MMREAGEDAGPTSFVEGAAYGRFRQPSSPLEAA
jgi:hypothetical protein